MAEDDSHYHDGKPIRVKAGLHGLGAQFGAHEQHLLVDAYGEGVKNGTLLDPLYVPYASFDIAQVDLVASREHSSSNAVSTIDKPAIVEFIHFGYSHRYYAHDYPSVAPHWRNCLITEARVLAKSIQADQAIAYEFLEGDGSLGGWLTHGIRGATDFFRKHPIPKPEQFDPLMDAVWRVVHDVQSCTAADYAILHRCGIQLMKIRYQQEVLARAVQKRIGELIDSADIGLSAAKEVESASFTVLDLYGQVRFAKSPASLAAYRCGVLMVRAGARYVGERAADNSMRKAIWEAGVIVRQDLPKAVSGLLLGYIKQGFKKPGSPTATEQFAEQLVGLQIWFVFFTFDFYTFEAPKLPASERQDKFFEKLAPELATEIFSAIVAVGLAHKTSGLAEDSPQRIWLDRIGAALPALVAAVIREYTTMKSLADSEKRSLYEVFCSEAGWAIVRILKATGVALAQAPIKDAMKQKMKVDQEYWRALILSIRLQLAQANPRTPREPAAAIASGGAGSSAPAVASAPVSTPAAPTPPKQTGKPLSWDRKVPRTRSGPDEHGNVGMNKFLPAAAKAIPIDKAKPDKLSRDNRRKVTLVRHKDDRGEEPASGRHKVSNIANSWRDALGGIVIRSRVGSPKARAGYEDLYFPGTEVGLKGWQRAHSQGAGTGAESREGIRYAPEEVNQAFQNRGIERFIREMQVNKAPGVQLFLTTVTYTHPGTLRLKEIQYKLEAQRKNGKPSSVFEASIEVEDSRENPRVTISADPIGDWKEYLR